MNINKTEEICCSSKELKDNSNYSSHNKILYTINAQSDLLSIPISTFLTSTKKIEFKGCYYKYLVNDVITRLEKKNIKGIRKYKKKLTFTLSQKIGFS